MEVLATHALLNNHSFPEKIKAGMVVTRKIILRRQWIIGMLLIMCPSMEMMVMILLILMLTIRVALVPLLMGARAEILLGGEGTLSQR